MNGKQLKNSILQWAIQGKLVPQDPNDEPASVLLDKIRQEKERLIKEKKIKRDKNASIIYRGEDNSYYEKMLATGEVKCIDEEIPFEIPQGWEWCRLRDLCTVFGRIGFRGYTRNDIVEKGFGAITLSPSNMQDNGNMNYSVLSYISWKKYEESPEIKVKANDVLIVKTGSSYGKTCIISDLPEKATINPQIAVLKYSFVNNQWLTYFLNAPFAQEQFRKYVIGTSIPTFSQEKLSSTLLPLPPKNEQEHLTKKLSLLDKWIGSYNVIQQLIDRLNADIYDKLKKSILQEAIQGKLVPQIAEEGTAKELLDQIKAEKQELVKEGKLKKSALNDSVIFRGDDNKYYQLINNKYQSLNEKLFFKIPTSWCWVQLRQVAMVARGGSPRPIKDYLTDSEDGINWIKIGDTEQGGKYINATKEKICPKGVSKSRFVHKGDFLLTNSMSFGRPYITNIDGCIHDGWLVISPFSNTYNQNFLYYLLSSNFAYRQFVGKVAGGVVKNLNSDKVADAIFPLPPLEEQQRIVAQIEKLFEQLH